MALLSVRVFFKKCPPLVSVLSSFPETVPRYLVQEAQGSCVEHASLQGPRPRPPKLFCGEDGQWVGQPTTSCACLPGFEPVEMQTRCAGETPDKKNKTRIFWQTKQWDLRGEGHTCLRGNKRRRKLMRQESDCDTVETVGKVNLSFTHLWKGRAGSKASCCGSSGFSSDRRSSWRAQKSGAGEATRERGAPGKDCISLRTSKQSTQEKKEEAE